jgi:predicted MFS family arabinose efflux permease
VRSLTAFWSASLPFALIGAFTESGLVAIAALLGRGVLMTAAVPTMDAFTISAFAPAERSAAQALVTATWAVANGAGALVSGAVRAALGPDGFTVNIVTLVVSYIAAIAIFAVSFGRR